MTDPTGWPEELREPLAEAIEIWSAFLPGDAREAADRVLVFFAPYLAARVEAAAVAMREALSLVVRQGDNTLFNMDQVDVTQGMARRAVETLTSTARTALAKDKP